MSGRTVGATLDRALGSGPAPRSITVDHGTEFMSRALEDWARGVQLDFIRPGKPVENAFIESFNGRLRDDPTRISKQHHRWHWCAAHAGQRSVCVDGVTLRCLVKNSASLSNGILSVWSYRST
jgi:putative transposase